MTRVAWCRKLKKAIDRVQTSECSLHCGEGCVHYATLTKRDAINEEKRWLK